MSEPIILPCGNGFTLRAEGANLVVVTKRSEEVVPISRIQSFMLKEPRGFGSGTIVFTTAQAASSGVNLGLGFSAALGAERTFFFSRDNLELAKSLRDYIVNYEAGQSAAAGGVPAGMVLSVADEIRGLKGLLDDGILTQEEFDAKKKQLLGI